MKTELQQLAIELSIQDRVHYLNHIAEMADFYNALDVFCLASLLEGLPLVALEAQACAVPVVMTDVGAVATGVHMGSGVVVPAADSAALVAGIKDLLNRERFDSPRNFIVDNYNLTDTVRRYDELYRLV